MGHSPDNSTPKGLVDTADPYLFTSSNQTNLLKLGRTGTHFQRDPRFASRQTTSADFPVASRLRSEERQTAQIDGLTPPETRGSNFYASYKPVSNQQDCGTEDGGSSWKQTGTWNASDSKMSINKDPFHLERAKAYARFTTTKNLELVKRDAQKRIATSLKFSTKHALVFN